MFVRSIVLLGWLISATATAQAVPKRVHAPRGPVPNAAPARPGRSVPVNDSGAAATAQPATSATPTPASGASPAMPAPGVAPSQPLNAPATTAAEQAVVDGRPIANEAPAPLESSAPVHRKLTSDPLFLPAVIVGGAGAAVLLASLITGLAAHGIYTTLEHDCKNDLCPSSSQSKLDSGKTLAVVSTVLTGVGIGAVGVSGALLIMAANRSGKTDSESARLQLSPGPTPLGLGATATF
jgi:hypothetical protein